MLCKKLLLCVPPGQFVCRKNIYSSTYLCAERIYTHQHSTLLARIIIRAVTNQSLFRAARASSGFCESGRLQAYSDRTASTCSSTRASSQPPVPIGGRTLTVSGAGRTRTLLFLQARCVPVTTMGTTGSPVCSAACTNPFLKGSSLPFLDRVPSGNRMRDRLFFTTARATCRGQCKATAQGHKTRECSHLRVL